MSEATFVSPDPDIERAYNWMLSFLPAGEWDRRRAAVEEYVESLLRRQPTPGGPFHRLVGPGDQTGWYLYLVETALYEPHRTEVHQAARVLPVFKRLGADLDRLLRVNGVEAQAAKLLGPSKDKPDSVLFELLVALLWARDGWPDVAFIPATPADKRPDFRAAAGTDEWFVEAKRLAANSEYALKERAKWLRMWWPLKDCLVRNRHPVVLDIAFHVELETLADDFVLRQLEHKLPLVTGPCHLISDAVWDVSVRFVDHGRIARHLERQYVKTHSRQLQELIGGGWERGKGFTHVMLATTGRMGGGRGVNEYVSDIRWAAGAYWRCDAERAVEAKARDIRRHLADAVSQLPAAGRGVVHVGLETPDGEAVEAERFGRIIDTVTAFDAAGKDLRWVYVHLYESYSPPDAEWVLDETVYRFGAASAANPEPLALHYTVLPGEAGGGPGAHWLRAAP